jgi:cytochrome c553
MDSMAQALKSDDDVKVLAAYFASQPSPLAAAKVKEK